MYALLRRKKSIRTRLFIAAGVIFSILFIAPDILTAKIIYVETDTTVTAPYHTQKMITLDMDKDGEEDFAIAHNNPGSDRYVDIFTHNGGIYLDAQNNTIALNNGFDICKSISKWKTTAGMGMHFAPEWYGGGDLYVGIRFKVNDVFRYGWILMSIPSDTSSFSLKGYAYEDEEGAGIKAGDQGPSTVEDRITAPRYKVWISGGAVTIYSDEECARGMTAEIYDMTGALIGNFKDVHSGSSLNCDLRGGAYILRVNSGGEAPFDQIISIK